MQRLLAHTSTWLTGCHIRSTINPHSNSGRYLMRLPGQELKMGKKKEMETPYCLMKPPDGSTLVAGMSRTGTGGHMLHLAGRWELDDTSCPCSLVSWTRGSVPVTADQGKACPKGKHFLKSPQSVLTYAVNHKRLNLLRFLSWLISL